MSRVPGHSELDAAQQTTDALAEHLQVWDQTIGCEICSRAWWAENCTPDPTKFHSEECPLYEHYDAASRVFNLVHLFEKAREYSSVYESIDWTTILPVNLASAAFAAAWRHERNMQIT